MAHYLDTSALVKLVVVEAESSALRRWLRGAERVPVSSDLARAELLRAVRRVAPDRAARARLVLESVALIELSSHVCAAAGLLAPELLRTLDALHLAAALELGDDLEAMVTYDERLADAAAANGVPVVAPGAPALRR